VTTARARVPFDFSVKNRTVLAGDYEINRHGDGGVVWSLRNRDKLQSAILIAMTANSRKTSRNGKLTFHRYGNKYFLVNLEISNYKVELGKSRAERRLQQQLENDNRLAKNSVNGTEPEIVAVKVGI
jgi:hypothetical protein